MTPGLVQVIFGRVGELSGGERNTLKNSWNHLILYVLWGGGWAWGGCVFISLAEVSEIVKKLRSDTALNGRFVMRCWRLWTCWRCLGWHDSMCQCHMEDRDSAQGIMDWGRSGPIQKKRTGTGAIIITLADCMGSLCGRQKTWQQGELSVFCGC